jgi:hypothetical protein
VPRLVEGFVLNRSFSVANVVKGAAATVIGPIYIASSDSFWELALGLIGTAVAAAVVVDELFGFGVLRRRLREERRKSRTGSRGRRRAE